MAARSRTILQTSVMAMLAVATVLLLPSQAGAMSRSLAMARAEQWESRAILYSQSGWADESGTTVTASTLGWRRDCSGFVSMCWNLPCPGATTRTLGQYADAVTKEALQPGDALVAYDQHAVLFGGWADDAHTSYWAYEMSSSQSSRYGDGSVARITPYPYWGYAPNDPTYQPYRLKSITGSIDYTRYTAAVSGENRYGTAVAAARLAFGTGGAKRVVVASGENWPDALGASALAGALGGPVLLVQPDALPAAVRSELGKLGAREAVIVGGESAVSRTVESELKAAGVTTVSRVSGADRYATARAVGARTVAELKAAGASYGGAAFVVTGEGFADALAASSFAAAQRTPVLLTEPATLSAETSAAIGALGVRSVTIIGGKSAVGDAVASELATRLGSANVTRVSGADRYKTAEALTARCLPASGLGYGGLAIGTGESFPDALAGGVMAARLGTFLELTPSRYLQPSVARTLSGHAAEVGAPRLLGGLNAISPIVRESVALALGGQ